MTIFNDQQLRKTLWAEYAGLQKQVDAEVARLLELNGSPWPINPLDEQTVAELQAAICRIRIVRSAHSHRIIRTLRRMFRLSSDDTDEFDGQGLA